MLMPAINELTALLQQTQDPGTGEAKAKIIIDFAEGVAMEVLRKVGFQVEGSGPVNPNLIAHSIDSAMDGAFDHALWLINVPTTLTLVNEVDESPSPCHEFTFFPDRVIDYDANKDRVRRVLTYEETARFVIFWLAEKIIQIIRKNQWDRIQNLVGLFDKMSTFLIG